ncbi:MAG: DUF3089 domain-containing protein [Bacteroidetes bacterium]|nr:MAG: DUF3089 domain-containing protein [Bacteroidota bacterium]
MKSKIYLLVSAGLAALLFFTSCDDSEPPAQAFEAYEAPPAPDYAQAENWAALPEKQDSADLTPPGVAPENQANVPADVFFIHPTTYMGGATWNASTADQELNITTDKYSIKNQASVFNHAGRVYAPRYRQMCYGGFFATDTASEHKALRLAYSDVKRAFEYYLKNHNQGRPIIIASHSQGSVHALWLVKEFFDGKPLQNQLVAAYIVGWPFHEDEFKSLPVCAEPSGTGCVVGWCTWREGCIPKNYDTYYKGAVVVNPISWRYDEALAPESEHKGFLWRDYEKIYSERLFAQAHGGILWVKRPLAILPQQNYHIGDYNLFWLDIRTNVALRSDTWLSQNR